MEMDSPSVAAEARRCAFPPPEVLHLSVQAGMAAPDVSRALSAREPDPGRPFSVSVTSASPLKHDLMRSLEEYVELIGCLKQIDDLPPGEDELRARREREVFESLGRVRRAILGLCRQRGLD